MIHNEITAPWMAKGRWYQVFIESDGSSYSVTHSDLPVTVSAGSSTVYLPSHYRILDYKVDINQTADSVLTFKQSMKLDNDKQGVIIPGVATFDYLTAWIFAYEEV